MRRRSPAEAQVLRSSVALLWLGGRTETEIADVCRITATYVGVIIHGLRAQGWDMPRRKHRRAPVKEAIAA